MEKYLRDSVACTSMHRYTGCIRTYLCVCIYVRSYTIHEASSHVSRERMCVRVWVRAYVRACVRVCVRVCARARACAHEL